MSVRPVCLLRLFASVALATAVAVTGLSVAHATPATISQSTCTNATISGTYGYSFTGSEFVGPDGTPQPGGTRIEVVAVGSITYDGQGGFTGSDNISVNGNVRPRSYTGTYSVQPNCTATSTIDSPGGAIHTSFVINNGGNNLLIIVTDPGTALLGEAQR
jgi:hypothetical protein